MLLALILGPPCVPAALAETPEPTGYRDHDYHAPTPATLRGARVVSTEEAHRLWRDRAAIFIDVMPRVARPPNLPPHILWRGKHRENIPGSAWLPDVGFGGLSPETDAYFRRALARLTGDDRTRLLLFYCMTDCWMSWNAAKRALEYGYANVAWYAEGADVWSFMGLPLEVDEPEP
ncbi:MAG: PQQ-dependent catabolism-associated CXXCW motif protein [Hyphomicrobiales bacterium]|nr:PQQ-dependent catabolism-associated CXXCW motif protein [Hyphomicrobiales bacterium]